MLRAKDNLDPNDESVDTPLGSPFLDLGDDFDDDEVLNELEEYGNAGQLCCQRSDTYVFTMKMEILLEPTSNKLMVVLGSYIKDYLYSTLEKKASKKTHKLKRLYKIGSSTRVESSEDASLGDQEDASKQGIMIADLDTDEGVSLVDETQGRNDQDMFDTSILDDEEVAEKEVSTAEVVTTAGVVTTIGVEAEGSFKRAESKLEQEDAKRQRIKEENKFIELKRCLEIIPDDEDDVKIEATPLYSKSPIIVDYKIYKEGRKSFFKIIRADGMAYDLLRLIRRQINEGYVLE
uniref:Uncharacterized protein n=1 Tax=Tanacetum cinerariifolium TaxID=118510 RepID=A0A6L2KRM5_TANCI|nr:hypothetical protein [Tanacetum cinerariifolium]